LIVIEIDDIRKAGVGPVDMQQSIIGPEKGEESGTTVLDGGTRRDFCRRGRDGVRDAYQKSQLPRFTLALNIGQSASR